MRRIRLLGLPSLPVMMRGMLCHHRLRRHQRRLHQDMKSSRAQARRDRQQYAERGMPPAEWMQQQAQTILTLIGITLI